MKTILTVLALIASLSTAGLFSSVAEAKKKGPHMKKPVASKKKSKKEEAPSEPPPEAPPAEPEQK